VDELLRKNLKAYLRLTNIHERTSNEEWIDQQRTELDQQCSQFLQSSLRRITTFRQQIHALPAISNQPTLREHWESVALSLEGQLKQLSERQRDQQLIRRQQQQAGATAVLLSASQELSPVERESILRRPRISFDAIGQLNSEQLNTFYTSPVGDEDQPSLIPHDERMMLEQENDQLLEELLGLETEVK
jgi:hypothetical protein